MVAILLVLLAAMELCAEGTAPRCTEARRRRLAARAVCRVVEDAAARAGLGAPVTPRTLRYSFATHLMDRGVDLAVIASLLGPRSPTETGVYLHVLPGRPREAVDRLAGNAEDLPW